MSSITMSSAAAMLVPRALNEEMLERYCDVIPVGRMLVNGEEIMWPTAGSNARDLGTFSAVFCNALRKLPHLESLPNETIAQAAYWFCKAVSINYVLCDVVAELNAKIGKDCSIETTDRHGRSILDYCVDVNADHTMRVRLSFRGKDNIVHRDWHSGRKSVEGTVSSLTTDIPLCPPDDFTPVYEMDMKLKQPGTNRMLAKITRTEKKRKSSGVERICVKTPIRQRSSSEDTMMSSESMCSTTEPASPLFCVSAEELWSL